MTESPSIIGAVNHYGNGTDIRGWVSDRSNAQNNAITVVAYVEGKLVTRVTADSLRPDKTFAFTLNTEERIRAIDIISGRFRVFAVAASLAEVPVPFQKAFLTWMTKVAFGESMMVHMDLPAASYVIECLAARFGPTLLAAKTIEVPTPEPTSGDDMTPLYHRVGTVTADRSAILGKEGVIFLYEGGNALTSQYKKLPTDVTLVETQTKWMRLIEQRQAFLQGLGIAYCQTIIPEKTTANAELFPEEVAVPTPLCRGLENWALDARNGVAKNYVSLCNAFQKHPDRSRLYLKTDSHFSVRGAWVAFQHMLENIAALTQGHEGEFAAARALLNRPQLFAGSKKIVSGDLTMRFFGTKLYELDDDVNAISIFGHAPRLKLLSQFIPQGGGTTGTRRVWLNSDAPLKMRVVSFGNSFFERGSSPTTLGWWFSQFFEEYHLIWNREILEDYVRQTAPDCVVCQTVERFLTVVPTR